MLWNHRHVVAESANDGMRFLYHTLNMVHTQ